MDYECVIADEKLITKKWDYEIKKHNNSSIWEEFKEKSLRNMENRIVYMGLLNGEVITECTAIISSRDLGIQNKENLVDDNTAYLMAFRTNKEYEGKNSWKRI